MRRMLCTNCGRTDAPNTLIGGSDALELIAWCCLLLPGLVYCWWRHASRRKVCAHCGSLSLIRESRAARERNAAQPTPTAGRRLVYAARPIPWLAPPGQRLRRATRSGALVAGVFAAWAVASVDSVRVQPQPARVETGPAGVEVGPARVETAPARVETASAREQGSAPRPQPTEAALQAAAEARARAEAKAKTDPSQHPSVRRFVRRRECEKLCTEFHGARAGAHRDCFRKCVGEFDLDNEPEMSVTACADVLDPESCGFGDPR